VVLGCAPRIGAAQALGGAQVCPNATWCMGHDKGFEADLFVLGLASYTQLNGYGETQFYWVKIKDFKYFNFYYN